MKKGMVIFICFAVIILVGGFFILGKDKKEKETLFPNFVDLKRDEVVKYANDSKLTIQYEEQYSDKEEGTVITQSKVAGSKIITNEKIIITVSKGEIPSAVYQQYKVDELGRIPVMMYHGIQNKKDSETSYTGGNVDKDGYNRTAESFRRDLETYYQKGYRMVRLADYVNGKIDVKLGNSPIILTFDDGNANNIFVTGLDANGEIIIDPNSAVGILEEFKHKYPDFQVTATFFVNGGLFQQEKYNEQILNWLVKNGYDIGNHSYNHANFNSITKDKAMYEIASVYQKLDGIIPNQYVNIVALPFGNPNKGHKNFVAILGGNYQGYSYHTDTTLRVGWESDYSPFSQSFDKTYIKRIRAYDNKGIDFDVEYNLKALDSSRYISDGDVNTITVPQSKKDKIRYIYNLKVRTY